MSFINNVKLQYEDTEGNTVSVGSISALPVNSPVVDGALMFKLGLILEEIKKTNTYLAEIAGEEL